MKHWELVGVWDLVRIRITYRGNIGVNIVLVQSHSFFPRILSLNDVRSESRDLRVENVDIWLCRNRYSKPRYNKMAMAIRVPSPALEYPDSDIDEDNSNNDDDLQDEMVSLLN